MTYKPDLKKTYENMLADPEAFTTTGKTESNTGSQERRILAWLKLGHDLTSMDALQLYGCFRLGARIFNLRRKGHPIKTTMIKTYSGKRIARYSYEQG